MTRCFETEMKITFVLVFPIFSFIKGTGVPREQIECKLSGIGLGPFMLGQGKYSRKLVEI